MPETLFPENLIEPATDASAPPLLWVRRLVLIEGRKSDARLIREMTFRRGLNVVRVIDRPKGHSGPVGHSVGKTLLTRFIRYCLGERYYAKEEVTAKIVELFPTGHVIAEIEIGGVGWIVVRPFDVAGRVSSAAGLSTDWRDGLDSEKIHQPYDRFAEALSQATTGQRPALYLPDAKRNAAWLDLLGWLSRDQDCNFSHFNIWRSKDAHSGSREHTRSDASLVAAWGLDLVNTKDAEQRAAHQKLLTDKEQAERVLRRETANQAASRRVLIERFPELSQEQDDTLFTQTAGTQASEKVAQLKRLKAELEQAPDLKGKKKTVTDLRKKQNADAEKLGGIKGAIQAKESQIQTEESANLTSAYALTCFCPDKPTACPHNKLRRPTATEEQKETIRRLQEELRKLQRERVAVQTGIDALANELSVAEQEFDSANEKYIGNLTKLGEQIGRWEAHVEEVTSYSNSRSHMRKVRSKLEKLAREIGRSEKRLRKVRRTQEEKLKSLSAVYTEVVTGLLAGDTQAKLLLGGWGVRPQLATALTAHGLGMATLATVIGFDLAAIKAAISRRTSLPAFLIHDSPKASDMEPALYDRIYDVVLNLEESNGNQLPLFQYIVTSTTVPPAPASESPYVCLTLDARIPEGRLLGVEF